MRLIPHNELEREQHDSFEWRALGIDPQFLLVPSLGRWLPGWRMLELTIEHDQACATARVFLDTGQAFTEAQSLCLRLSSGQAGKRVLFLPASLKALRFDPLESEGRC